MSATRIQRTSKKNPLHQFLQKFFTGLDRWPKVVRVSFPKLDKALLNQQPGSHSLQLIVAAVPGPVTMTWEAARLFYPAEMPRPEK